MIYYDLYTRKSIILNHYNSLKQIILSRVKCSKLEKKERLFIETHLEEILTSVPDKLYSLDQTLKSITYKIKNQRKELSKIFNYDFFIKKSTTTRYTAYDLAEALDVRTCLYCNRQYTITVIKGKKYITRPEFDHFFDKATYPLLALSIFNLIPSCHICNSTLKGSRHFDLDKHFHPYVDDTLSHYKYTYVPYDVNDILGNTSTLEIKIQTDSSALASKIQETKKIFQLENIYNGHVDEFKDLFEIRYKLSETYLEQLLATYTSLGISYDEIYKLAFGVYYKEKDFIKRPFSKAKKDLLIELGVVR